MDDAIAVIGAGAIGGYLASQLALAGRPVTLCVRTPFERLVVEDDDGARPIDAPVLVDPTDASEARWVLLATKAHQTEAVSRCGTITLAMPSSRA